MMTLNYNKSNKMKKLNGMQPTLSGDQTQINPMMMNKPLLNKTNPAGLKRKGIIRYGTFNRKISL